MSEFNFKSQICTNRQQSERLLALGLKRETADMHYAYLNERWNAGLGCDETSCKYIYPKYYIPAWSLGRLWELYWSNKVVSDCLFGCGKYMNPYAKMIAMIEYDIEDGTFNKDYLDK